MAIIGNVKNVNISIELT